MAGSSDTWRGWMLGKPVRSITQCLRTGLWQAPVGYTGLVTAQDSPGDWKLGTVEAGIGFLPLVNLTRSCKTLKYGWYLGRGKA